MPSWVGVFPKVFPNFRFQHLGYTQLQHEIGKVSLKLMKQARIAFHPHATASRNFLEGT